MMKTWWTHPDKKHRYYKAMDIFKSDYFILIKEDGSLSSMKVYNTKEDAIKDGWKEISE